MKSIVTNAAAISILRLIDNTLKTGGGPISIGATVIQAPRGPVGKISQVNAATWENIFGKPYPKTISDRTQMEGLRHLNDAARECAYVNVVRVLAEDAKFPSIEILATKDKGAWAEGVDYVPGDVVTITDTSKLICVVANTSTATEPTAASADWDAFTTPIETSAQAYGTAISVSTGYLCSIYPIDGDPCLNRSIKITDVDPVKKRFTIKFYDKNELGEEYLLEYWQVGCSPLDKDDMGRSVFIETLLEERSSRFRCDWQATADWDDAVGSLNLVKAFTSNTAFEGGTNGGTPTTQDWIAAWDMFRNDAVAAYLMFAAGNYDEDVLQNCVEIAELRHTMFFFDAPPIQNQETVLTWIAATSIDSRFAASYHCPVAAKDQWYGGKTVWGASGAAAAACAIGDANFSGDIPGIHYAPAGRNRGKLKRTNVEFLFPTDIVDRDAYYDARINPVVTCDGAAIIDDSLTMLHMANYSRFIWVNRIANYIDYRFSEMATYLQHEPDAITAPGLKRGMKKILDDLVTSGALSKPRTDAAISGVDYSVSQGEDSNPYIFVVEQPAIDQWLVTWEFCPTGSARRIVGQPILIL